MDRVVGNHYFKPRRTGEMEAVIDAAKGHGAGKHGNAGLFGSMAGVPGVFRPDGLPTDVLLQSLQQGGRFEEFQTADQLREYVIKELRRGGSRTADQRLRLGDLNIDPQAQWWVPSHLRAVSNVARTMRTDRAAQEADTDFDPMAYEKPPARPPREGESRWTLRDLKKGKYDERRQDVEQFPDERGAEKYPQSVFDALAPYEFDLLAQLQLADPSCSASCTGVCRKPSSKRVRPKTLNAKQRTASGTTKKSPPTCATRTSTTTRTTVPTAAASPSRPAPSMPARTPSSIWNTCSTCSASATPRWSSSMTRSRPRRRAASATG
jgi:hypothetical protein